MPKGCKYIYNNKTYTREEFMALLAGGEYRNILASNEMPVTTGMTDLDIAEIESTGILGTGTISLRSKSSRSNYIDSLKLERMPVHENVSVVTGVDPETLNGQVVSSTLSDKLVAGVLRGKDSSFKFLGGIGYGPATGRWWAFSQMSDANKLINTTEVSKDGYKYLVPALMSDTSHLSNKNMTIMVMNLFKEAAANGELNTKQFKALVDKTFNRVDLIRHKPYITEVMKGHTKINELIEDIQDAVVSGRLTFEDRKAMVSSFVGDSIVNKPKFKTVGTITELASDLAEPMAKGVPLHNVIVVYRTKGDLKAVETNKDDEFYHESYGVHIESSSEIEVMYLDGAYPITDLIPEFTTKGTKKSPSKTYRTSEEVLNKVAKGWTAERALTNLGRTHGLSAYSAPVNIKTKSRVSASPEQFSDNVAETIDKIKAATSEDGATLNLDGTVYEDGGLVVPAGSVNVSQKGVSAEGLYKFLKDNENNISSDIFKIGLYKFADRAEVSYDLNIVIPREHRDVALEFGKLAGQESLFDLDSYENIKTGSDGKNPITFTPEQLASIAEDLSNGVLPDIEGMLKGTQEGSVVGGDMEATAKALELALKNNPDLIASIPSVFNHSTQLFDSNGKEIKINEFEQGNRIFRVGKTEVKPIWFSAEPYAKGSDIQQIKTLINTNNPFDFNSKEQRDKLEKYAIDKYGNKYKGLSDDIKDGEWDQLETSLNGSIPALIKEMGYDSYYSIEGKQTTVAVFDAAQVKIATPKAIAEAYRKAKTDGTNPELVKAVEQSLKDTQAGTDMQDTGQIVPDKVDVEVIDKKSQYYKEAKDLVTSNVITYGEPRLVIVEKGKVVAALTLEDSDFEYKADMAVVKAERNKGLSKKLIDGMIRDFVNSNLEQIRLEVTNKNLLNNLTNNFGFESQWNEDAGADYAYMSKKQAEAYVKNNDKAGQQSLVEDKFKQYEKGYNKVQAAEGGAKKRKANEELKNILADSPSAKYIIDNMSYIYKQLEDKGLASKNDQCPI